MKAARQAVIVLTSIVVAGLGYASPITAEQAKKGMTRWLRYRPTAHMDANLGAVESVKTVSDSDGESLFHVVSLEGGGFIITSTDDHIRPVVAFADSGTLVEDDSNPLWAMLNCDMPKRKAAVSEVMRPAMATSAAQAASVPTVQSAAVAEWADLLDDDEVRMPSKTSRSSISSARVAALVSTKWNQKTDANGYNCYNLYTPNNYYCGCGATAMAQLMRYHSYPTTSVAAQTFGCWVDGTAVDKTMMGGVYDWSNMVNSPKKAAQRKAIGKLCYDVGVAMKMSWSSSWSASSAPYGAVMLTNVFGYANAMSKCFLETATESDLQAAIFANLDGGCPVVLQIDNSSFNSGHILIADGYGFYNNVAYTHLNFGWAGSSDAWYTLPAIGTDYDFSIVGEIVFNVFPDKTGELLTGYVTNDGGTVVSGATVKAVRADTGERQYATTNAKGGYALNVEAGTWVVSVSATGYDPSATRSVTVKQSTPVQGIEVDYNGFSFVWPGTIGNSWGNDFVLESDASDLTAIALSGADSLKSGESAVYTCTATLESGKTFAPTPTWEIASGAAYATLTEDGVLTALDVAEAQSVTLQATYMRNGVTRTATKVVTVKPKDTLNSALDNTTLTFTTGGASAWFPEEDTTCDGVDALRSGVLGNYQTNWVETVVSGRGTLSFNWMVSSAAYYDYLEFLVDGEVVKSTSGTAASWEKIQYGILAEGMHTIRWQYRKSHTTSRGLDAGFLDGVEWLSGVVADGGPYQETVDGVVWTFSIVNGAAVIGYDGSCAISRNISGVLEIPATLGGMPVCEIGKAAFSSCTKLTGVTIPESVTNIGERAFQFCIELTGVTIPGSVKHIGSEAFDECWVLPEVSIPESVESIGSCVFGNCRQLASINVASDNAFYTDINGVLYDKAVTRLVACPATSSVDSFPATLTEIEDYAFYKCKQQYDGVIPSGVKRIGAWAFANSGIASMIIPSSVTNIGDYAFAHCSVMWRIQVADDNAFYAAVDDVLYDKAMRNLIISARTSKISAIPNGVTNICAYAFEHSLIKRVTFPSSLVSIGELAFFGAKYLTFATLPFGVKSIGQQVFSYCYALEAVAIPASVTNIKSYLFSGSDALKTVFVDVGDEDRVRELLTASYQDCSGYAFVECSQGGYPALSEDAGSVLVAAALAGSADSGLAASITNGTDYCAYMDWAGRVKGADGSPAGISAVRVSPCAWLSFALDADSLLTARPQSEDIQIEAFTPATENGKYEFTVSLKGVAIGSEAQKERLKKVFGLKGATSPDPTAFSAANVDVSFAEPSGDGKVHFTATPLDQSAAKFFMNVNVTP